MRFVEGQGPLPVKERKEEVVRVVIGACNLIQEYQPVGVLDALQKVRRGKGRRAFPKLHRTNERGARVGGCPHVDSINLATRRGSQVGNQLRLATAGRPVSSVGLLQYTFRTQNAQVWGGTTKWVGTGMSRHGRSCPVSFLGT